MSEGDFSNPQVCKKAVEVLNETGGDATKASEAICHMAIETGSQDNISCMIVILGGAGGSASATTKTVGLTPGSLLGTNNASYVKAYTAMCERGGVGRDDRRAGLGLAKLAKFCKFLAGSFSAVIMFIFQKFSRPTNSFALNLKNVVNTAENEPRQVCCVIRAREPCMGIVFLRDSLIEISLSDNSR